MLTELMQKFISWLDPKLDRFRTHKTPAKPTKPTKYTPKTLAEFIEVLKRTPKDVLSDIDRARIAAIMSYEDRKVSELMIPKSKMAFVKKDEVLGPLVLDKLYKSGFTHFPVVDSRNKVKGIIHTEALNALEIKKTDRADKYLNKDFNYLHASDLLPHAVAEIIRTGSYYFLILDETDSLAGFFTVEILLDYLLGK
ncbi:MAG: CBS domain-containing protein [Candidatus Saccharibacteria bacterium]|nr:CBS domain-containing protein [Candidatus Saccharibacteria bacterium]